VGVDADDAVHPVGQHGHELLPAVVAYCYDRQTCR
jgi:hypothetical protein